jgi:hypothetical protein
VIILDRSMKMTNLLVAGAKYALKEKIEDISYWRRRRRQFPAHGETLGGDRAIVEALRRSGGYVTSLDALGIPGTREMVAVADEIFRAIADRAGGKGGFVASAPQEEIDRRPALIRWGLDERLLDIVESYISMSVDYRGLTVRRDIMGGDQLETRLWHRDYEDRKIVKIIVYLNDVDRGGGGYEFIPRTHLPIWRIGPLADASGRIDEPTMRRVVPKSAWHTCSGPRGTVAFSDTCSVYHRGTVAHSEDRHALFFCYNSRTPRSPGDCLPLFDRPRFAEAAADLSARQRAAIGIPPMRGGAGGSP